MARTDGYSQRPLARKPAPSTRYGHECRVGPRETDAVSGWDYPAFMMVEQRGGMVAADMDEGSLDLDEETP